ncbi:uncharacterized protein [Parasteatoda tepidariorum]|uniref:uncharacterized protein n=1 Tax=Parasteatoda tepidariorum TaxID=114398 RepID=UPI00077FD23D|nr:uncharacterized protein LOC107457006 [Parasteatoda tepidariorum]
MTPYVVQEGDGEGRNIPQKPKSIMVGAANGVNNGDINGTVNGAVNGTVNSSVKQHHVNGNSVHMPSKDDDAVETPDSLPSRSSVSGRSIIGNGKNGRSGALKRVSFGSSKGSMVETLVYDHQEDLSELPAFLTTAPVTNGDDSRVHPAKVRVKFIESQHLAQVACAPPSPDVTLDFGSDTMTSPASEHSPDYHRQISHESGIDNPFRPDGELSREADTIVSLIKEGKPITPVKGEETSMDGVVVNGVHHDQMDSFVSGSPNGKEVKEMAIIPNSNQPLGKGANGSTPKVATPGIVEVQRSVIMPPSDTPQVEQVILKKKPKCNCCVIQ